ncbi:DNA mismatch repair protein MutS, partial [Cytophagales bacterium RKSG123]|nr:DNA mismatch repair protein MutS [Xanthovirga aplysinae]
MLFRKKKEKKLKRAFGDLKEERFNFELISKYFLNGDHSNSFHVLSEKTCNDLDFEELYMFLDRTYSKPGQQLLYDKLRAFATNEEGVKNQEELIKEFSENEALRLKIQQQLSKLNDFETYYLTNLFHDKYLKPP